MPRELHNQFQSGSDLNEMEMFRRMIDHLGQLHTLSRGMAQSRKDLRWQHLAKMFEQIRLNTGILMYNTKQQKHIPLVFK